MPGIYPRTIDVYRPRSGATDADGGLHVGVSTEYGGDNRSTDDGVTQGYDQVLTGLPCSIQLKADNRVKGDLPAGVSDGIWRVFIPRNAATLGDIKTRDEIVDDQGDRYIVDQAYWNILGYQLRTMMLDP